MTASRRAVRVLGLVAVLLAWWVWSAQAESLYFPPLSEIVVAFADNWLFERVTSDLLPSLSHLFAGLAIAVVVGVLGGLLLGLVPALHRGLNPVLEFLRALPPPVFLSVGLLVLGTGTSMKIAVVALGPVWPVLLNTVDGVRGTDPARLDMARVFGISRLGRLVRVTLPSATPRIMAGVRVAIPLALILTVISELVASTEGIGYFVVQSSTTYAITDMWSGILLLGLLGWALTSLFELFEARVLRWERQMRGGSTPVERKATTRKGVMVDA